MLRFSFEFISRYLERQDLLQVAGKFKFKLYLIT